MSAAPERIALSSGDLPLKMIRRRQARRFVLRLDAEGAAAVLVLPRWASLKAALRFLDANRDWLERRIGDLPSRIAFADGAEITVLGQSYRLRHDAAARGRGAAWIEDGEIRVAGEVRHLARRTRDFLRELARRELTERARHLAARVGRKVTGITVRDTKSRWGSCSAAGSLVFSWRLVLAPPEVMDYVVAHEVAHLVHMNHGKHFWRLVAELNPDSEDARSWLRRNRSRLLRIG